MKPSKKTRWYMMVAFAPVLLIVILKAIKYSFMAIIDKEYSMDFNFIDYWITGVALILLGCLVEFAYCRMRDEFLNEIK